MVLLLQYTLIFASVLLLVALGGLGWWLCGSRTLPKSVTDFLERVKNMRS